jgi:hypothetical protein
VNASEPGSPAPPDTAPATLLLAVTLLRVQAAGLAVVTAYLIYQDVIGEATSLGVAIALTCFAALAAAGVALLARALARRSSAARGPAIVVQLMLLVVSYYMLQADLLGVAVPLITLALVTGVALLAPPTTRALGLD